jgi:malate dehydrogenase (oxaloacetate-decarboxylating)
MDKFDLRKTADGYRLSVPKRGSSLLRFPLYNKGTAFSAEERKRFHLEGLLPSQVGTIDIQAERVYRSIMFNEDPVGRNIDLALLQDRNEHLYYKVLSTHLEDLMPIVYTPTVGKASQYFSHMYRRERGIWITPEHAGRIEHVLRTAAPFEGVQLMVVTDNEAILGIGDQGAGGMAISVGKLALYVAAGGIHPARTLPISLDVGTDNEALLQDPLYLGWREKRLRGEPYMALLDEFVEAAQKVFPGVVVQWEDFHKDNAVDVLHRYRKRLPSFNDDIQGTGAVAYAAMHAACRINKSPITDARVLIFGAGAAGYGIADRIIRGLRYNGLDGEALARAVLAMDSRGVISDIHDFDDYKKEIAWPESEVQALGLDADARRDLAAVVKAYRPNVLIGTSGQAHSFDERVVRTMAQYVDTPVIMPMSNPTVISEATPEDIMAWTDGRALIATGSPFPDVETERGTQRIGQANNVFIFPGLGIGTIISGASEVTPTMIGAASKALAECLSETDLEQRCLMPKVSRLWEICGHVAIGVAERAMREGVAETVEHEELIARLEDYRWRPVYPEMVEV